METNRVDCGTNRANGADAVPSKRPFSLDDPSTWRFRPQILVHDVGTTEDRSTAVLGGVGSYAPDPKIGVAFMEELPRGLRGTPRANALAEVDLSFDRNSIIIADLSNDQSYAEQLSQTFGARVIGVSIGPSGDGMTFQRIAVPHGAMLKYALGRTWLFDRLRSTLESAGLKLVPGDPVARQAFGQLTDLEEVTTDAGNRIYACQPSKHDDLAISLALLVWAARHPHVMEWMRLARPKTAHDRQTSKFGPRAWT